MKTNGTLGPTVSGPEGERFELVDGVAYTMSPAPQRRHQETSGAISRQFDRVLAEKPCEVYFAPSDVKLSPDKDDDAPTVVRPDITVTCNRSKLTEQGMTWPSDLVVEIVSPESGLIDRRRRFDLYERFGAEEYWIRMRGSPRYTLSGRMERMGEPAPTGRRTAGDRDALRVACNHSNPPAEPILESHELLDSAEPVDVKCTGSGGARLDTFHYLPWPASRSQTYPGFRRSRIFPGYLFYFPITRSSHIFLA